MNVLLFGATGMVGQGVLRECLLDPRVGEVIAIGRGAPEITDPKLRSIVHPNLYDLDDVADDLAKADACFFCLGVSSVGMAPADYHKITYELTLSVAGLLADRHPGMTFVYVSGRGTDSTESGRVGWARIKGATENALLKLPLKAFMFRPGVIQPMHGATSKTRLYATMYAIAGPLLNMVRRFAPDWVVTTETVGRAMIAVAESGYPRPILESADIAEAGLL